ncbi:Uma2 family endonuclease [Actinoplanes sp. NPDC049681]|uniref:Uma2 family endonuclease n=1 Tax=Actinoplanes sp. NPDC049681 TaxID=3363905 RepID=UPI0037B17C2A
MQGEIPPPQRTERHGQPPAQVSHAPHIPTATSCPQAGCPQAGEEGTRRYADFGAAERQLAFLLHRSAREAGMWAYPGVTIVSGDDLFIPDFVVLRRSGGGKTVMPIAEAVLMGEIVSGSNRRKDIIDRPREYAAAGVPFFLRVDFRNRIPSLVLHELVDGEYLPVVAAAAGGTFAMRQPFEFSIDPADLLDEEG